MPTNRHVIRAHRLRTCLPRRPRIYCSCPGGPVEPDGLGECSRCHRTREPAIVRCILCGSPDVREVESEDGSINYRCIDCGAVV